MILDANQWNNFLNSKDKDMEPVHKWLENKNGKLVYSTHKKIKEELDNVPKMKNRLNTYRQAGKAQLIDPKKVEEKINDIKRSYELKSNDPHILGLAKASDTKILCSNDKKLHEDFKKIINGNIYQNKSHQHLLNLDICP